MLYAILISILIAWSLIGWKIAKQRSISNIGLSNKQTIAKALVCGPIVWAFMAWLIFWHILLA